MTDENDFGPGQIKTKTKQLKIRGLKGYRNYGIVRNSTEADLAPASAAIKVVAPVFSATLRPRSACASTRPGNLRRAPAPGSPGSAARSLDNANKS